MTTWSELPAAVRDAVQGHVGPIAAARDVTNGGKNHDLAVVVVPTVGEPAFVKGVAGVSRRMRMLRNEAHADTLAPGIAPSVLFADDIDVDDWLIVGTLYVPGRSVDLLPGSPDLPRVADAVTRIGQQTAPGLRSLRDRWGGVDWWGKLAVEAPALCAANWSQDEVAELAELASSLPELADGEQLVHTDLHADQFRVCDDGSVQVIDWGFPGRGAAWVDPAFMVLRLIEAGHEPADAEAWARANFTGLVGVGEDVLDAFAAYLAGMWSTWAVGDPSPGMLHRARLAREYAAWRMGLVAAGR